MYNHFSAWTKSKIGTCFHKRIFHSFALTKKCIKSITPICREVFPMKVNKDNFFFFFEESQLYKCALNTSVLVRTCLGTAPHPPQNQIKGSFLPHMCESPIPTSTSVLLSFVQVLSLACAGTLTDFSSLRLYITIYICPGYHWIHLILQTL